MTARRRAGAMCCRYDVTSSFIPYFRNEIITKMASQPDPFYTLRPHSGEITALSFINNTGYSDKPLLVSG